MLDLPMKRESDRETGEVGTRAMSEGFINPFALESGGNGASGGMDTMGAALAHELNQPLTALMIYIQSLIRVVDADSLGEQAKVLAEKALREAERATEIVRRMRRFTTRGEPERQPLDLNGLAMETIEAVEPQFLGGIDVVQVFDPAVPILHCDPVQIRQVLTNLLRNASESLNEREDPRITVTTRMRNNAAELVVADNGNGISDALAGRLFKAFATTKPQGIGLGLAISRMIAQNHGGELELERPGDGQGASFCFRLPVRTKHRVTGIREGQQT
jgi:two-component system, LuxR family, sensor kinase FixL